MGLTQTKLYRVRLRDGHKATASQIVNGYLAHEDGAIAVYTRGEAIKKARWFGGKIEFAHIKHEDQEATAFWNNVTRLREFAESKMAEVEGDDDWFQFENFADVNIYREDDGSDLQVVAYPLEFDEEGQITTNTNHGINIW